MLVKQPLTSLEENFSLKTCPLNLVCSGDPADSKYDTTNKVCPAKLLREPNPGLHGAILIRRSVLCNGAS